MAESLEALRLRQRVARELWNVTLHTNVLYDEKWKESAVAITRQFQVMYEILIYVHARMST